jgi:hypothetical protein
MSVHDADGCFAILILMIGLCVIAFMGGEYIGRQTCRRAAVERGYASWVPDSGGNVKFTWNEEKAEVSE